ncbi:hypothetical protein HNO92_002758 [Chromobacterium alkanivorans]|nr:hypothetical protein [Chromobacterium alkanivorans]MCS3819586.1 hypothetical protein [Chromobacterium alkanivorans]MCS3874439.1 hypothetical protein [Chromobacterium alkanivorans]
MTVSIRMAGPADAGALNEECCPDALYQWRPDAKE